MPITINSNSPSNFIDRQLNRRTSAVRNSFEKLSSGKEINKASDNPANLAVALELLTNAETSAVAARNISDGVSAASIADGALQSASDINIRLSELATQSANGTLSDTQRTVLNDEFQQLTAELDRIAATTEFNGTQLLATDSSITIQAGVDGSSDSRIDLNLPGVSAASLGLTADISTQAGAQAALTQINAANETLSSARGDIGGAVSRLNTSFENLRTSELNSRAAASRITDLDFAKETANLAVNRIGQQAAVAVRAQANLQPSLALTLLGN